MYRICDRGSLSRSRQDSIHEVTPVFIDSEPVRWVYNRTRVKVR